jgi:preprotein translocase subunit YajC
MDTLISAAAKSTSSTSNYTSFLFIFVLIALFMLVMFRSNRRRQQNAQQTQRGLTYGARVRTVHGIYGVVRDSDDQNVMVEVAPGVQIKMLRQAVGTVLPDDGAQGASDGSLFGVNTMPDADAAGTSPDEASQQSDGGDDASAKPQQSSDLSR